MRNGSVVVTLPLFAHATSAHRGCHHNSGRRDVRLVVTAAAPTTGVLNHTFFILTRLQPWLYRSWSRCFAGKGRTCSRLF